MEKIKRLRVEIGMSQKTLSEGMNINKATYSLLETGRLKPLNIEDIRERAMNVLKPKLMDKILKVREDLERLESMSLMFKSK